MSAICTRTRLVALILFLAVLGAFNSAAASADVGTPSSLASGASPTLESVAEPAECRALKALAEKDNAVPTVIELFVAQGSDRASVANVVVSCLVGDSEATPEERVQSVCGIADALINEGSYQDAYDLLTALRATEGNSEACKEAFETASGKVVPTTTPEGLGVLWRGFVDGVLEPISPGVQFVGVSSLVLLGVGRLMVLLGVFRNTRSRRGTRVLAWGLGAVLAILVPAALALRGMWLFRGDGPVGEGIAASPSLLFFDLVWDRPWQWWALLLGAVASVLCFAFAFATTRSARVTLESKNDGSGLDRTRLMEVISAMAGGARHGLDFPVGTDISTAVDSVRKLSDNKFFAGVQAVVTAIFSSSPWDIVIENESEGAVSIAISRNGRLVKARRLALTDHPPLVQLKEPAKADLLAALAAGEIVGSLQDQYRSEMRPGLHGATDSASIALQFISSSGLQSETPQPTVWKPTLQRAIRLDPLNRAATVTLWFFEARFEGKDLDDYRKNLLAMLDREVKGSKGHSRRPWSYIRRTPQAGIDIEVWRTPKRRLRENEMLVRLANSLVTCERNLAALGRYPSTTEPSTTEPSDTEPLLSYLLKLRRKPDPPILASRRSAHRAISAFINAPKNSLAAPDELYPREREAWDAFGVDANYSAEKLRTREEAVLTLYGDFHHSPEIAYNYACRLSVGELFTDEDGLALTEELLGVALQRETIWEWAPKDPELKQFMVANKAVFDKLIEAASPKPFKEEPASEDLSFTVLIKRLLSKMAKS